MRRLLFVMLILAAVVPASAGPFRNAYLSGTMPWHRTFRDVNLCTGNLMKSFTDIQVAPALGAGLVLQRTYNSNDDSEGGFGHGWSHAYEIQMQEASTIASSIPWTDSNGNPINQNTAVVRTDFFGGKHVYTRDADGLYTPPPYLHDWMQSSYNSVLASGPGAVSSDVEIGLDGTVKHYRPIDSVGARMCDYIADRHGNTTNLAYDGNGNLSTVTDPSGRVLQFAWTTHYDSQENPHPRITQVTGPLQTVNYSYYVPADYSNVLPDCAGGEWYNLKSVTLDPGGLNRTTTYTYMACGGETGLLASVTDPRGNSISYSYSLQNDYSEPNFTGTVWVSQIAEPGGVSDSAARSQVWNVDAYDQDILPDTCVAIVSDVSQGMLHNVEQAFIAVTSDFQCRTVAVRAGSVGILISTCTACFTNYDISNNPINTNHVIAGRARDADPDEPLDHTPTLSESSYYGRFGNVLDHWVDGFSNASPNDAGFDWRTVTGADITRYRHGR